MNKSLLLNIEGLLMVEGLENGDRIGASGPRSAIFLFKNCKYNDVMEFIVLLLLNIIK